RQAVPLHVVHLAVAPLAEPPDQVALALGEVDAGGGESVGTECARALAELASQRTQIEASRRGHGATTQVSIIALWPCRSSCTPRRRCAPSMPMPSTSSGSRATRS